MPEAEGNEKGIVSEIADGLHSIEEKVETFLHPATSDNSPSSTEPRVDPNAGAPFDSLAPVEREAGGAALGEALSASTSAANLDLSSSDAPSSDAHSTDGQHSGTGETSSSASSESGDAPAVAASGEGDASAAAASSIADSASATVASTDATSSPSGANSPAESPVPLTFEQRVEQRFLQIEHYLLKLPAAIHAVLSAGSLEPEEFSKQVIARLFASE
ncbi:hypothetical protein [Burkholderia cepacia]|uniref:hypothetical protein n=1 Tax=Burkholderia cepacia TaxID=292 RepID=UPI001CF5A78B|nr:hypothetical protein [Burkholderia cepacia]MCA8026416.1 hypothetical protein [Burkholderia cepacia]